MDIHGGKARVDYNRLLGGGYTSRPFRYAYLKGGGFPAVVAARMACYPEAEKLVVCLRNNQDEAKCQPQLVEMLSCQASFLYPDEMEQITRFPPQSQEGQRKLEALLERTKNLTPLSYGVTEPVPRDLFPIEIEAGNECEKQQGTAESRFGCLARRVCPQSDEDLANCLFKNDLELQACDKELSKVAECVAAFQTQWKFHTRKQQSKES